MRNPSTKLFLFMFMSTVPMKNITFDLCVTDGQIFWRRLGTPLIITHNVVYGYAYVGK